MSKKDFVLKMHVNICCLENATKVILEIAKGKCGAYVCVSNVHMCMEVHDSPHFAQVVNRADLVVADGRPILWAQRLLGNKDAEQVRGQDLMSTLCAVSGSDNLRIGLYGGFSSEILCRVTSQLRSQYPTIQIVYSYSPPFRPLTVAEDAAIVQDINEANVDVLFVGIGCPKQELWMADHKPKLSCVMLGVGAAFDFIAGSKKHAPRWMQKVGLEWLFRLISEPKRLWKRYLKQNPRFIYYFLQQWLLKKDFTKEGPKDV